MMQPRFSVTLEESDGSRRAYLVQADNRDAVRWDMTRGRRQWPSPDQAPFLWSTFMAWSAMNRAGDITDEFEAFEARCLEALAEADEAAGDAADPTRPDLVSGS